MCHQQNWSQDPPFMHSFLMMPQVSSGSSIFKITVGKLVCLSYLSHSYSLSGLLAQEQKTVQVQSWAWAVKERDLAGTALWKEDHRNARGEGSQRGRGKDVLKTATGKHGIPGLKRQPRVAGSFLSDKYVEKIPCLLFRWLVDRELPPVVPIMPLIQVRGLCQDIMVLAFLTAS